MKSPRAPWILAFSLAATLPAGGVFAQASTSSPANPTNAATSGSAALNTHGNPAGAIGAAQMGSTTSTIGTTVPTSTDPTTSTVSGIETIATAGGSESIGMRRERLRASTDAAASGQRLAAPDFAAGAGAIRSADIDSREQLRAQVEGNIDASERAMASARAQAKRLDSATRTDFTAAANDVRAARRRLEQSLKTAQRASASDWDQARSTLAANYEAFIQAVAQAQRIASTSSASDTTRSSIDRR